MAQIIGLHPDNLISPIDFIPGVGPIMKIHKGIRLINKARKTRKKGGVVNYVNAFGDDLNGLANVTGGYMLAKMTTLPLIPYAVEHRDLLYAYGPGGTASAKVDWWIDYLQ